MSEEAKVAERSDGGYVSFEVLDYRPPFFFSYPQVLNELVSGYGNDPLWSLKRCLVLLFYLQEGKTAEETAWAIQSVTGHEMSATGVRQLAFRLTNRATKLCEKLGIEVPQAEPERLKKLHFDRCQWEHRHHPDANRQEDASELEQFKHLQRARTPTAFDVEEGVDGNEELLESLNCYGDLSRACLADIGAVEDERDVALRYVYVPFLNARQIFSCSPQKAGLKPLFYDWHDRKPVTFQPTIGS